MVCEGAGFSFKGHFLGLSCQAQAFACRVGAFRPQVQSFEATSTLNSYLPLNGEPFNAVPPRPTRSSQTAPPGGSTTAPASMKPGPSLRLREGFRYMGLYWGYIGIMENKMETTIYWGNMGDYMWV